MLAAVIGVPYQTPYTGPFPFLYVREAASAFVAAVSKPREGAPAFDLNGVASTIEEALDLVRTALPEAPVSGRGAPFPFPADLSDAPINAFLGFYRKWGLKEGVAETLALFRDLVASGKLGAADVR
jgi:nucleoside-diphosphate-sugar epimerase